MSSWGLFYLTWNVLEDLAASCDGESPEQGDAARHPSDLGIYLEKGRMVQYNKMQEKDKQQW
jgi:hypothetical protein